MVGFDCRATGDKMHDVMRRPIVCSLDVHDAWTYLFGVDMRSGEIVRDVRVDGHYRNVVRHLAKVGPRDSVRVLMEAGPHGFAPWRLFTGAGFESRLISPSSIRRGARQQKTDRDDAINNLQCHAGGMLRYVQVPSVEDEQARECLRERQALRWQVTKQKQKLLSLLKRQDLVYTQTKCNWTKKHWAWLRTVETTPVLRVIIDMHLERIAHLGQEEAKVWKVVDEYLESDLHHKHLRDWYCRVAGIGPIVSATLILEGGDLGRFAHPVQLMKYTGLMPCKRQSGYHDPALHITKAGNRYLRTALVSIAKFYQDRRMLHSAQDIATMPDALASFVKRCQDRLCSFYQSLRLRGKPSTKARVAVARELCGFLWEYAVKVIPQLEQQSATPTA